MGHVVNPHLFRLNYVVFWSGSSVTKKKFSMYFDVNNFYVLKYLRRYFKNNNFIDFFKLYNVGLKIIYLNFFLKIFLTFKQHRKFRKVIKYKIKKKIKKYYNYCLKKTLLNYKYLKYKKKNKINYLDSKSFNFFIKKKKITKRSKFKIKLKGKNTKEIVKFLKKKYNLKKSKILTKKKKFKLNKNNLNYNERNFTNLNKKEFSIKKIKKKGVFYIRKEFYIKNHKFEPTTTFDGWYYRKQGDAEAAKKLKDKYPFSAKKFRHWWRSYRYKYRGFYVNERFFKILNKKLKKNVFLKNQKFSSKYRMKRGPLKFILLSAMRGASIEILKKKIEAIRSKYKLIIKKIQNKKIIFKKKLKPTLRINKLKKKKNSIKTFKVKRYVISRSIFNKRKSIEKFVKYAEKSFFIRNRNKNKKISPKFRRNMNKEKVISSREKIFFTQKKINAYSKYQTRKERLENKKYKIKSYNILNKNDKIFNKNEKNIVKIKYEAMLNRSFQLYNLSKTKSKSGKFLHWAYKKHAGIVNPYKMYRAWTFFLQDRDKKRLFRHTWYNFLNRSKPKDLIKLRNKYFEAKNVYKSPKAIIFEYLSEQVEKLSKFAEPFRSGTIPWEPGRKEAAKLREKEDRIILKIKKIKKKIVISIFNKRFIDKMKKFFRYKRLKKVFNSRWYKKKIREIQKKEAKKNIIELKRYMLKKKREISSSGKKYSNVIKKVLRRRRRKFRVGIFKFNYQSKFEFNKEHAIFLEKLEKKLKKKKYARFFKKLQKSNKKSVKRMKNKKKKYLLKFKMSFINKFFEKRMYWKKKRKFSKVFGKYYKTLFKPINLSKYYSKMNKFKKRKKRKNYKPSKFQKEYSKRKNLAKYNTKAFREQFKTYSSRKEKIIDDMMIEEQEKKYREAKDREMTSLVIKGKLLVMQNKIKKKLTSARSRKNLLRYESVKKIVNAKKKRTNLSKFYNSELHKKYFKFFLNKFFLFKFYTKICNLKFKFNLAFNLLFAYKININTLIIIKKYWGTLVTADLIADLMILRLLQKHKINAIMITLLRFLKKNMRRKRIYGFAILIMGRFSRKDRAVYSWYKRGLFTRSSKLIYIDYANRKVALRFSTCSFKINIIRSLGYRKRIEIF